MFKDFDLSKMTQILSQAQQKANEFEESLATKEFESKSGGGLISVKINGKLGEHYFKFRVSSGGECSHDWVCF